MTVFAPPEDTFTPLELKNEWKLFLGDGVLGRFQFALGGAYSAACRAVIKDGTLSVSVAIHWFSLSLVGGSIGDWPAGWPFER